MESFLTKEHPHRRYNPLKDEWVLVSPHRTKRPWLGSQEKRITTALPHYLESCYLCPGNLRANAERNPNYKDVYVFQNDFSALLSNTDDPPPESTAHPLLRLEGVRGECRVICFSPRHDLSLSQMDIPDIRNVVDTWVSQLEELGEHWRWVQIFENKGAMMGCSNPHPHGQIWALDAVPNEPLREDATQKLYFKNNHSPLLLDYAELEVERGERLLTQNASWVAIIPFWAVWPFEVLLVPRRHISYLYEVLDKERDDLSSILSDILGGYDRLFDSSFPYSMGWHGAFTQIRSGEEANLIHWQLHAHFYPPLLRSALVRKFLVGFEMLSESQRDLTPEEAAEKLRAAISKSNK